MRLYQDAVRVEYRQGTYSVTVVTSVPWDTERVLRTLPCQVAARLSRRFSRSNLRILWRNDRLYSQIPRPFWRDLAGIVAIGSCSSAADPLVRFLPLHEPIVVQFHCVIEIDFSSGEKRLFPICVFIKTQYSFRISGNRGYDSNRVRCVLIWRSPLTITIPNFQIHRIKLLSTWHAILCFNHRWWKRPFWTKIFPLAM